MATAEIPSRVIALPHFERRAPTADYASALAAWFPLLSILAGIVSLFYLTQTSELTTTGYTIQQLQVELADRDAQIEQTSLEVAAARSLAAVEAQATKRMLMQAPKERVYLRVPSSVAASRATPSSRGEGRQAPALEKRTLGGSGGGLESLGESLSSVLAPGLQRKR